MKHRPTLRASRAPALLAALLAVVDCRGETTKDPPIVPIRNMYDQPRYKIQGESAFFADHRMMRPPVEGAVPREREARPRGRDRAPRGRQRLRAHDPEASGGCSREHGQTPRTRQRPLRRLLRPVP